MATFNSKPLAFIQLANSIGTILDPSVIVHIHNIVLHNANTGTEVVELFYHDGTNEYKLYKVSLVASETLQLVFAGPGLIILGAVSGAKLRGNTTTAAKVTCLLLGSEEV